MVVGGGAEVELAQHVGDEAEGEESGAGEKGEHGEKGERGIAQVVVLDQFSQDGPNDGNESDEHEDDAGAAKKMERAGGIFLPEPDRAHVQNAFHSPLPVVFGLAGRARPVVDHLFAYFKAFDLKNGRNKTVHFAVERHLAETFFLINLKRTAAVMDAVVNEEFADQSGHERRPALALFVLAVFAPAGNDVEIVGFEFFDERRDVGRIVLSVAVQRGNVFSRRGFYSRVHGGGLAEVAAQVDDLHGTERLQGIHCFVRRTVVNKNYFKRLVQLLADR